MLRTQNHNPFDLAGELPRNWSLIEKIRHEGYYAALFNKMDFIEAVAWASLVVQDFQEIAKGIGNREVIPLSELGPRKDDVHNAHFIMILYHKRRGDFDKEVTCRESLMQLPIFQPIARSEEGIVKRWVTLEIQSRSLGTKSSSLAQIMKIKGTETIYQKYRNLVTKERNEYQNELLKI